MSSNKQSKVLLEIKELKASIGPKEILKGLKEDQLVVVKGNENLRPNQAIKIKRNKKK